MFGRAWQKESPKKDITEVDSSFEVLKVKHYSEVATLEKEIADLKDKKPLILYRYKKLKEIALRDTVSPCMDVLSICDTLIQQCDSIVSSQDKIIAKNKSLIKGYDLKLKADQERQQVILEGLQKEKRRKKTWRNVAFITTGILSLKIMGL